LWRSLGAEVTLIEATERLLPLEDVASSTALARAFTRRGIDVRTGTALASLQCSGDGVTVTVGDGATLQVDQVLVAVGRRPNTAGVGLAEAGVLDERGYVVVDPLGRTSNDALWAVGDVLPTPALAHAAFAEGFVVADAIAGLDPDPVAHHLVPRVTYCAPEVASVGWTEVEARARFGDEVTATTQTMAGNAKALIEGRGAGAIKLVCAPNGMLVGAHVVGPSATELIAELGLATSWEALAVEVGHVVHAHPSIAESVRETALVAAGTPFHAHL
jgi:dihydrolipoamide dehydrogenase